MVIECYARRPSQLVLAIWQLQKRQSHAPTALKHLKVAFYLGNCREYHTMISPLCRGCFLYFVFFNKTIVAKHTAQLGLWFVPINKANHVWLHLLLAPPQKKKQQQQQKQNKNTIREKDRYLFPFSLPLNPYQLQTRHTFSPVFLPPSPPRSLARGCATSRHLWAPPGSAWRGRGPCASPAGRGPPARERRGEMGFSGMV